MELRQHEAITLQALATLGGTAKAEQVAAKAGLDHSAVIRAALTLAEKGLASVMDEPILVAVLTPEGRAYAESGLPERRIVNAVVDRGGRMDASDAARLTDVPDMMLPIVYGWLKRKGWGTLETTDEEVVIVAERIPQLAFGAELSSSASA